MDVRPGGSESRILEVFEMWRYRRMLKIHIMWVDWITNEAVVDEIKKKKRILGKNLRKRKIREYTLRHGGLIAKGYIIL